MYDKFVLNRVQQHAFVWIYSLVFSLVPLITTDGYGTDDQSQGLSVCLLKSGNHSQKQSVWGIMQFEFPLLASMVIMTVMCVKVALRYFYVFKLDTESTRGIRRMIRVLVLYPLFMILCWLPIITESLVIDCGSYPWKSFNNQLTGLMID